MMIMIMMMTSSSKNHNNKKISYCDYILCLLNLAYGVCIKYTLVHLIELMFQTLSLELVSEQFHYSSKLTEISD